MARTSWPPPGNTTTAVPVFASIGEWTVIVGRETLSTAIHGLPATSFASPMAETTVTASSSGPASCGAPGVVPGHIGTCVWPGDGCQAVAAAQGPANASRRESHPRPRLESHHAPLPPLIPCIASSGGRSSAPARRPPVGRAPQGAPAMYLAWAADAIPAVARLPATGRMRSGCA
jgi:hypothetical protein